MPLLSPDKLFDDYSKAAAACGAKRTHHVLLAPLGEKILYHCSGRTMLRKYPFSYSKQPPSCRENSLGTPWGLHEIGSCHGDGEPRGRIFRARLPQSHRWQDLPPGENASLSLVTTRILRLRGLEPGLNAGPGIDSWDRMIYIHGTNHPDQFPENRSAGCLLLQDEDLLQLFEAVPLHSHVMIFR
jgi:hypothetical protein